MTYGFAQPNFLANMRIRRAINQIGTNLSQIRFVNSHSKSDCANNDAIGRRHEPILHLGTYCGGQSRMIGSRIDTPGLERTVAFIRVRLQSAKTQSALVRYQEIKGTNT